MKKEFIELTEFVPLEQITQIKNQIIQIKNQIILTQIILIQIKI